MFMTGSTHWVTEERAEQLAKQHCDLYKGEAAIVRPQPDSPDCFEVYYLSPKPNWPGQKEFEGTGKVFGGVTA